MTKEQKNILHLQINSILKLGGALGFQFRDEVFDSILEYYEQMVEKKGFDTVISNLVKTKKVITSSTILPILTGMVSNAKKNQKTKVK